MLRRVGVVCCVLLALVACHAAPPGGATKPPEPPAAPADRSSDAVLSALRALDPCALIDPGGATLAGVPVTTPANATTPFGCDLGLGGQTVRIWFGDMFEELRRERPITAIGGARARLGAPCAYSFPVSFRYEIRLATESCVVAKAVAELVVTRLAHPEAVAAPPRWDACTALTEALGETRTGHGYHLGLGQCAIPGEDGVGLTLLNQGTPAVVERGETCEVTSSAATLRARDCATAAVAAAKVDAVLTGPPPAVAPQRPLLYRPDEPDLPYPTVCGYPAVRTPANCRPHAPGTDCAVAAVTAHFPGLTPVTMRGERGCWFHEPTGTVSVRFEPVDEPLAPARAATSLDIAHHRATMEHRDGISTLAVATDVDDTEPGHLVLTVSRHPHPVLGAAAPPEVLGRDAMVALARAVLDW